MKKSENKLTSDVVFWICLTVSIVLVVVGFCLPPQGVIDGSVLEAVGLLFLYATLHQAIKTIREGRSASFNKGDMQIVIGDKNKQEE